MSTKTLYLEEYPRES